MAVAHRLLEVIFVLLSRGVEYEEGVGAWQQYKVNRMRAKARMLPQPKLSDRIRTLHPVSSQILMGAEG